MFNMTLEEIARAVKGRIIRGDSGSRFSQVSTDTRELIPGSLFIALRGERFDAHDFVPQAVATGAGGVMISKKIDLPEGIGAIWVQDTLKALQQLATYNRNKFAGPLVAVTGSNGKTTTKDMIASVLSQRYKVLKTSGNYNNEIGLPLTLLKLDEFYEAVVVEMGMRGLGEIDLLARIALPTVGVITNIGESHLERLGSVENIARAKTELLPHLPKTGYAVLNGDDPLIRKYAHLAGGRVIFYGMEHSDNQSSAATLSPAVGVGTVFTVNYQGISREFSLPVPGKHNVYNALAAITVGLEEGLTWDECVQGISRVVLTDMRLQIINYEGITIVNDTYNANPASTKAALEILVSLPGSKRTVAVLGDMYELGDRTRQGHREVGIEAFRLGVKVLVAVGSLARDIYEGAKDQGKPDQEVLFCNSLEQATNFLKRNLQPGDAVLVKGSRGMKMEELIKQITCA